MAEQKQKPNDLVKFEEYQQAKYEKWKKDKEQPAVIPDGDLSPTAFTATGEQKAFDDYVKTVTGNGAKIARLTEEILSYSDWLSRSKKSTGFSLNNFYNKDFEVNDYVIFTSTTKDNSIPIQMFGKVEYKDGSTATVQGLGLSTGGQAITKASATSRKVPSSSDPKAEVEVKGDLLEFHFDIPEGKQGPAGEGGGGGTVTPIEIPPNENLVKVEGEYGLNLFDYREMSNDPKFRVSGHTFITNDKQQVKTRPEDIKKLRVYNRIKEVTQAQYANKNVTIKARLIESSEVPPHEGRGQYQLESLISFTDTAGLVKQIPINFNSSHDFTTKWTNNDSYGYLNFQIGGTSQPTKGKIKIDAYYGSILPERDDQKFVFKEYNGFTLYANGKGSRNVYKHNRWWDCIQENLNVVNLKDCELLNSKLNQDETKNIYWVKAPDDCLSYAGISGKDEKVREIQKMLRENLMSSNLCDITENDAGQSIEHSDKPFFVVEPATQDVYDKKKGSTVETLCFQIIIGKEYAYKWRNHLTQTQIIYPTQTFYDSSKAGADIGHAQDKYFRQLPLGGMIYVLNNGQKIETNKYQVIEHSGGGRALIFKSSPFGYPDIVINYDNIASVIPNTYESHDEIIL